MASAAGVYTRELRERFGYSATWVPNAEVRLGDVGLIRGHQYERVSSLADFGVAFDVRESRVRGAYSFASAGSVAFGFKAAGEPGAVASGLVEADAGVTIDFAASNASVFQAEGCTVSEIRDQHTLGQQVIELASDERWPDGYVVVCEVISADRTTVLVASEGGARVELRAKAGVPLGAHTLADADAGISLASSHGLGLQIVAEGKLTPLFRARGIARRFLSGPEFRTRGRGAGGHRGAANDEPSTAPDFVELDYADFD